jgi:hypothetical protein
MSLSASSFSGFNLVLTGKTVKMHVKRVGNAFDMRLTCSLKRRFFLSGFI